MGLAEKVPKAAPRPLPAGGLKPSGGRCGLGGTPKKFGASVLLFNTDNQTVHQGLPGHGRSLIRPVL